MIRNKMQQSDPHRRWFPEVLLPLQTRKGPQRHKQHTLKEKFKYALKLRHHNAYLGHLQELPLSSHRLVAEYDAPTIAAGY